jgi:dihydroflavonol-4-reductase
MPSPLTDAPVLVTGANGFIASQLIADLLAAGHRVRGTVRSLGKGTEQLRALPGAAERLELVAAELLTDGAFDAAMKGVTHVVHAASPYSMNVADPQRDLVDPAVKGTRNVLMAAHRAGAVERVVLTSSMAAITDEPGSDRVLTEADWNVKSTLSRNPYYLSKTLAEKEGWRIVEEEKTRFDLVVINPFVVVGPSIAPSLNASNQIFVDMLKGVYPGIMSLTWGMVDVRDVARAHQLALETPTAKGRYLCAAETISMREVVGLLRESGYGEGTKLPSMGMDHVLGDALVKLTSHFQPSGIGSYLRTHVGRVPRFDHGKIERELGLSFRPVRQSILDTMKDLERWKHIPSADQPKRS